MINTARREPLTIAVSFDGDADALRDFTVMISQNGKIVLSKSAGDAVFDDEGQCAYVGFSGAETALLRPYEPAYAQVRVVLEGDDELYSDVEEINVVDVMGA